MKEKDSKNINTNKDEPKDQALQNQISLEGKQIILKSNPLKTIEIDGENIRNNKDSKNDSEKNELINVVLKKKNFICTSIQLQKCEEKCSYKVFSCFKYAKITFTKDGEEHNKIVKRLCICNNKAKRYKITSR